ncbi:MAG: hypothetical protein JRJ85_25250, partial [Deltaproteobacteria bacterium]|nr:hypothetical protein [Deltaproteobacteria bacterium]
MGFKNAVFNAIVSFLEMSLGLLGKKGKARAEGLLCEALNPTMNVKTKYGDIDFFCPGRTPLMRAECFHTKEHENLDWIDTFSEDSVFWDVGANVGVFSLYAALRSKI